MREDVERAFSRLLEKRREGYALHESVSFLSWLVGKLGQASRPEELTYGEAVELLEEEFGRDRCCWADFDCSSSSVTRTFGPRHRPYAVVTTRLHFTPKPHFETILDTQAQLTLSPLQARRFQAEVSLAAAFAERVQSLVEGRSWALDEVLTFLSERNAEEAEEAS